MTSLPAKLIVAVLGLAVFFASSADAAKQRKHHKQAAAYPAATLNGQHWGLNLFMSGPFVVNGMQLTDDPDDQVVGAGLRVQALRARLAEWGPDAVYEDHVACGTGHLRLLAGNSSRLYVTR